jgi:hypothetical protein
MIKNIKLKFDKAPKPGMRESIREGMATPIEECDRHLEW